jgi:hypothetical protein
LLRIEKQQCADFRDEVASRLRTERCERDNGATRDEAFG